MVCGGQRLVSIFVSIFLLLGAWPSHAGQPSFHDRMLRFHLEADPHQPSGAVIFLGDSITQGLAVSAVAPAAVNYSISGQDTRKLLADLPRYKSIRRARLVVLTIGTNDVSNGRLEGIEGRLRGISEGVPVPLLWHAVPPNSRGDIAGVNRMIRRVCAERPDCTYIETRFDRRDFWDGVHLTLTGYSHWIASLQAAVGRIDRKRAVPASATPAP